MPLNRQRGQAVELLYVGWLIRRKGVDLIIRAMARLVDAFPSIRLRIVGDGPQRRSLEELAAQLGVDRHILFEGAISNSRIADCYADADIFVSMSYSESFGQTLVEAMLAGLPVISAINVGSREIIENGTTGFLVEAGDVGALVERLRELIGNAFQRTTIGARSRQVARQRYNWEMIGEQYLDLYRSVLQRREVDDAPR